MIHRHDIGSDEAKLRTVMFARALLVSLVLALMFVFQAESGGADLVPFRGVYWLVALQYLLLIVQGMAVSRGRAGDPKALATMQLVVDVAFVSALVFLTGGVASPFAFFYVFVILGAAVVLDRKGVYGFAAVASASYALLGFIQYAGALVPRYELGVVSEPLALEGAIFTVTVHIAAFVLVAMLGSYLVEERRAGESAVRRSSEQMRRLRDLHTGIVESISSGVMTIDRDGCITSINRAGCEITGFSLAELDLESVELLAPDFYKRIRAGKFFDAATGERGRWETRFRTKSGDVRYLGFSASRLDIEGAAEAGARRRLSGSDANSRNGAGLCPGREAPLAR